MPQKLKEQEDRITQALEALDNGSIKSISEAAWVHKVPRSTLSHRRLDCPDHHDAIVAQQKCTEEEEDAILNWI
jgi:hypothetical protein